MALKKPSFGSDNPNNIIRISDSDKGRAAKRFLDIMIILEKHDDTEMLAELELLFDACVRYVKTIIKLNKYKMTTSREDAAASDLNRRTAHNSLIAQLEAFNRKLGKKYGWKVEGGIISPGGICTLPSHHIKNREKIGDWSWALIAGMFDM